MSIQTVLECSADGVELTENSYVIRLITNGPTAETTRESISTLLKGLNVSFDAINTDGNTVTPDAAEETPAIVAFRITTSPDQLPPKLAEALANLVGVHSQQQMTQPGPANDQEPLLSSAYPIVSHIDQVLAYRHDDEQNITTAAISLNNLIYKDLLDKYLTPPHLQGVSLAATNKLFPGSTHGAFELIIDWNEIQPDTRVADVLEALRGELQQDYSKRMSAIQDEATVNTLILQQMQALDNLTRNVTSVTKGINGTSSGIRTYELELQRPFETYDLEALDQQLGTMASITFSERSNVQTLNITFDLTAIDSCQTILSGPLLQATAACELANLLEQQRLEQLGQ